MNNASEFEQLVTRVWLGFLAFAQEEEIRSQLLSEGIDGERIENAIKKAKESPLLQPVLNKDEVKREFSLRELDNFTNDNECGIFSDYTEPDNPNPVPLNHPHNASTCAACAATESYEDSE